MSAVQIQSMRPWHEKIIDKLLANPGRVNYGQIAAELGVTPPWLSTVIRSDVFREEYTKRRQAQSDHLTKEVIGKQLEITLKALDKVGDLLDDADEYDLPMALKVATDTARAMNFSPAAGGAPKIVEKSERLVRRVTSGVLEEARERMQRVTYGDRAE